MVEADILYNRIKGLLADSGNRSVNQVLIDSGAGKDLIVNMRKKGTVPSVDKYMLIASFLHCSTDYLLGRVENPKALYYSLDDLESAPEGALVETRLDVKSEVDMIRALDAAEDLGIEVHAKDELGNVMSGVQFRELLERSLETKKAPAEAGAREYSTAEIVQRYLLDKGLLRDREELTDAELEVIGEAMDNVAIIFQKLVGEKHG